MKTSSFSCVTALFQNIIAFMQRNWNNKRPSWFTEKPNDIFLTSNCTVDQCDMLIESTYFQRKMLLPYPYG